MKDSEIRKEALEEFRVIYEAEDDGKESEVNPATDAVVVFSGHGYYDNEGKPITWVSPENIVRIGYGIDILKQVLKLRMGKDVITNEDIKDSELKLFLSGEGYDSKDQKSMRSQLDDMERIAVAYNFPRENIVLQNCVIDDDANTLTQFKTINNDPEMEGFSHITIITDDYHTPRVERTAKENLRKGLDFQVIPAPQYAFSRYNVYKKVAGEIRRIVKYAKQGNLSPSLKS